TAAGSGMRGSSMTWATTTTASSTSGSHSPSRRERASTLSWSGVRSTDNVFSFGVDVADESSDGGPRDPQRRSTLDQRPDLVVQFSGGDGGLRHDGAP